MKANEIIDARDIRSRQGVNQLQFWSRLGVTQSAGSRYENGRNMPRAVQHLLRLVHVEKIDIAKIRRDDYEVIEYLRSAKPDLLKELKKQAKSAQKGKNDSR